MTHFILEGFSRPDALAHRLEQLGFKPGRPITLMKISPSQTPSQSFVLIKLGHMLFALRPEEFAVLRLRPMIPSSRPEALIT